jgi:Ca-activated chloride channel homolog
MLGGPGSFGVGGYYRTPIEEVLPVRLKAPMKRKSRARLSRL